MPLPPQSLDRDRILAIARRPGVTNVKVFGSFARGDADRPAIWIF
jgi:predicted nucleotidyltransferase